MLIKASRITNLTDARYFAAREVDFLGFNLESGTPGYLDPIYMKAMREWVEGPRIVGEFSLSPAHVVREAAAFYGLDAVQLRADTHGPELAALEGLTVLLELPAAADPSLLAPVLRAASEWAAYFVLDFTEKKSDQDDFRLHAPAWKALFAQYPVLLRLDAAPEQLPALLQELQPAGLDLLGGEEEQVGLKSFDEIEAIFDLLERDGGV